MPRKRDYCVDDGELHLSSQANRALKKARKAQLRDDGYGNEATNGYARDCASAKQASSSSDAAESGEEARDERTSNIEGVGGSQKGLCRSNYAIDFRETDHGSGHVQTNSFASAVASKYRESKANNELDNGRSDGEGDEDASENEEIEQGIISRRSGVDKEEAYSDSSQSSSGSSDEDSGRQKEELDDEEKRSDKSTAFGRAFQKIMKKKLPSTVLTEAMGPILSAHKQLVNKKLEEAAEEQKVKSESKKAKQALREKGHTVPALFPAAKEKELLKLATRGVVKLFNAVSKAQSVQEAAASKKSDAKDVAKRSKSTFLATLQGGNGPVSQSGHAHKQFSDSKKEGVGDGQPGWSALRETFMLGKSRLKDWDKNQEDAAVITRAGSSDDDSDSS